NVNKCHLLPTGRNCTNYEYRCSNSRCIPKGNLCDTQCDCAATCEDESLDQCSHYYTKINGLSVCRREATVACTLSENGKVVERCIGTNYTCNGFNDCLRNFADDEYGCEYGDITRELRKDLETNDY
ncbi:unnamed protein product, partial [Medioppia subpectinata]